MPKSPHRVKNYDATKDIVECLCGDFTGTAEEYSCHRFQHVGKKLNHHIGTLDFLKGIQKARAEYYLQGSTGFYNAAEEK